MADEVALQANDLINFSVNIKHKKLPQGRRKQLTKLKKSGVLVSNSWGTHSSSRASNFDFNKCIVCV
jgi:hypothetical protein